MAQKRLERPRDPVQHAKLVGDIATGQIEDRIEDHKDPAAVERGRKGGHARAAKLTPIQRRQFAEKAAHSRWKTKEKA
jgi:hypothetical protein